MRQVEFTETVRIRSGDYHEGDKRTFEDHEAAIYINAGWAKDAETGETGERVPGAKPIDVHSVKTAVS